MIKLYYFDVKGLAEGFRLAMHISNIQFEDIRIKHCDIESTKGNQEYLQLPMIEVGGKRISQTCAILGYIGDETNMLGKDKYERAKIFELYGLFMEMAITLRAAFRINNEPERTNCRKELNDIKLPYWLYRLNKLIEDNQKDSQCDKWAVGDQMSIVDLFVYGWVVGMLFTGNIDGVNKDICTPYKSFCRVVDNVGKDSRIQNYYQKL